MAISEESRLQSILWQMHAKPQLQVAIFYLRIPLQTSFGVSQVHAVFTTQ